MAYDSSISAPYSGRPAFNLYLYVRRDQTDVANNRSSYAWALYARNPNRSKQTYALDCFNWSVWINGQIFNGCHNLDFRSGTDMLALGSGTTGWFGHDGNGYLNVTFDTWHGPASVFGTADPASATFSADRIPRTPATPSTPSVSNVTAQGMTLSWSIPDNRGAAIDSMLLRRYPTTDTTSTDYVDYPNAGNVTSRVITDLNPATAYTWVVYARNAVGYSGQSGARTVSTLPATPPGMTVQPSLSGQQAVVTLTPPSGSSGVTSYDVEYRLVGAAASSVNGSSPLTVSGLTPGKSYEWRARAKYGSVNSPWTDWETYFQPNPNTSPGQYFDGSSADTSDVDFQWVGAANNSVSRAVGKKVTGWRDFAAAAEVSGGTGAMYRVTGAVGRYPDGEPSGAYAARYTFFRDATAAGFRGGTENSAAGRAAVNEGGVYYGSMYAQPSRAQRLAASITWVNGSTGARTRVVGPAQVVPANTRVRLAVVGEAPADGYATVEVVDVAGDGWSLWRGGDGLLLDAAMLTIGSQFPYFDGDAPDTGRYEYSWLGTANASASARTTLAAAEIDPLEDPDCPAPPSPPTPPAIVDDCITEVGTWRRYWVQVTQTEVARWLATIPTLTLTTGSQPAREVRVRYYENPDNLAPQDFTPTEWSAEQIVRYLPPNTVLTIDGVSERARASVAGGDWIAADHLIYGTGGGPATWPVLACGVGYLISLDVPLDANLGNLTTDLALTKRML
ncbi:fibronectin type III domain protein [Microbacterium phage MO526]|uniref:Fibronectin type III domain protein n=1 Tax=Microbacterium phage MO526 TaxID=3108092 RepID=A0ABZ0ZYJ0_9CAUD|nr:fibronectin type III domain protein [Microbacterium phage MO526]